MEPFHATTIISARQGKSVAVAGDGQVSLGHAAFYGLGAYAAALCSVAGVPFVASIAVGIVVAAVFGVIVGFAALRVRDDFLAIVTMGVGFLFLGVVRKQSWLGAEMGIAKIPSPLDKTGYALLAIGAAIAGVGPGLKVTRGLAAQESRAREDNLGSVATAVRHCRASATATTDDMLEVAAAMTGLMRRAAFVKYLGSYPAAEPVTVD